MKPNSAITTALSFDDVLLMPGYADFIRDDTDISTKLTKNISLDAPFVSTPMDTVTDARFAIALAKAGGIGILHRNLRLEAQAKQVAEVKAAGCRVGAATGVGEGYQERVAALAKAKVDVICIDAAHGYTDQMIDAIKYLKKTHPHIDVIAGNVATAEGAEGLAKAGADAIRVGMGPGSICTTRIVSGMGVPQLTAILETSRAANKYDVPVIADGGIKYSGDMIKALAAGASTVMMGSLFAATEEAPGETVELDPAHVPDRFKSIFNGKKNARYRFKQYRAMGSEGAMKEGSKVNAEDEFHGKSFKDRVLVAEGVESLVPLNGSVQDVCDQSVGGIRSGMFYVGARTIAELQQKARFIQLTAASLRESHPHDVIVTNPGDSYK